MKAEGKSMNYRELAERFYLLDTDVYKASGSELGKVFPGPKHISEKQILKDIEKGDFEKLKDELILIGNMIKIIQEEGGRDSYQSGSFLWRRRADGGWNTEDYRSSYCIWWNL